MKSTANEKKQKRRAHRQKPPTPQPTAFFLDKTEVAKRLGMNPRTVGNWALNGKIPAYRFGQFLRFKWEEVEQALAANFRAVASKAETLKP